MRAFNSVSLIDISPRQPPHRFDYMRIRTKPFRIARQRNGTDDLRETFFRSGAFALDCRSHRRIMAVAFAHVGVRAFFAAAMIAAAMAAGSFTGVV